MSAVRSVESFSGAEITRSAERDPGLVSLTHTDYTERSGWGRGARSRAGAEDLEIMVEKPPERRGPVTVVSVPCVHDEAAVQRVGGRWMAATSDDHLHTFEGPEGVSEVAERIVELVDGVRTVGDIATVLTEEFEVSRAVAETDTVQFISQLIEKRVLRLAR